MVDIANEQGRIYVIINDKLLSCRKKKEGLTVEGILDGSRLLCFIFVRQSL